MHLATSPILYIRTKINDRVALVRRSAGLTIAQRARLGSTVAAVSQ